MVTDWKKHVGIFTVCVIGAHTVCKGWTSYICPRQPTHRCQCECHTEENKCSRCDGTGKVYDEVFEHEWAKCPYWDHNAGLQCVDGLVVPIPKENHE